MHRRPAVRVAHIVRLALLQESVVLVAVTARRRAHASTSGAEVVLLLEVVGRIGREGRLALRGKGGIGDCVGESAGSTEVPDIAERHPGC